MQTTSPTFYITATPCPSLIVAPPTLRGADVVNGFALNISLAPPATLASRPWGNPWDPYLFFSVPSTPVPQPTGFVGGLQSAIQNVTWRLVANGLYNTIEAQVPRVPSYSIIAPEQISVVLRKHAVAHECAGTDSQGLLLIVPNSPSALLSASSVASSTVAAASGATLGAAAADAQLLALIGNAACAGVVLQQSTGGSMYLVSPFYRQGYAAILLGNMGLSVLFYSLQHAAALIVGRALRKGNLGCLALARFPSLSIDVFLGLLGVAYTVAIIGVIRYWMTRPASWIDSRAVPCAVEGRGRQMLFHEYDYAPPLRARGLLVRTCYPLGRWGPEEQLRMFGRVSGTMRGGCEYWAVYPYVLAASVIVAGAIPFPEHLCPLQLGLIASCVVVAALAVLLRMPFRAAFQSYAAAAVHCCTAAVAICAAVPTPSGSRAQVVFSLLSACLIFVRAVHVAWLYYFENYAMNSIQTCMRETTGRVSSLINGTTGAALDLPVPLNVKLPDLGGPCMESASSSSSYLEETLPAPRHRPTTAVQADLLRSVTSRNAQLQLLTSILDGAPPARDVDYTARLEAILHTCIENHHVARLGEELCSTIGEVSSLSLRPASRVGLQAAA
jgi:hypothetical protein